MKLVCDKIGVPLRTLNRNKKPGWEIRLEEQVKKLQQHVKVLRKEEHKGICWNEKIKIKQQTNWKIHEEINQKILTKEERLKRYRDKIKEYNQTGQFKIIKENSTHKLVEKAQRQTNN